MPLTPLLSDEHAPLLSDKTATLLNVSPVGRHMENLDALRIVCMLGIILTHTTGKFLEWSDKRHQIDPLFRSVLSLNVACRYGVPCFMMISFFIYWHQLYEKGRSWPELLWRHSNDWGRRSCAGRRFIWRCTSGCSIPRVAFGKRLSISIVCAIGIPGCKCLYWAGRNITSITCRW